MENKTVIPPGCKKYRFNGAGEWIHSNKPEKESTLVLGRPCVYECVSINTANAVAKFCKATETAYEAAKQVLRLAPGIVETLLRKAYAKKLKADE